MISQEFHHNFMESFDLCSRFQFWKDDFEDDGQFLAIKTRFWMAKILRENFIQSNFIWRNTHETLIFSNPTFTLKGLQLGIPLASAVKRTKDFQKPRVNPPNKTCQEKPPAMLVFQCHLSHFVCLIDCLLACFGWFPSFFFLTQLLPLQKC